MRQERSKKNGFPKRTATKINSPQKDKGRTSQKKVVKSLRVRSIRSGAVKKSSRNGNVIIAVTGKTGEAPIKVMPAPILKKRRRVYASGKHVLTSNARIRTRQKQPQYRRAIVVLDRLAKRDIRQGFQNIVDALKAIAASHTSGYAPHEIQAGLSQRRPGVSHVQSDIRVIEGTSIARPSAVKAALDILVQNEKGTNIAVFGTMQGKYTRKEYARIGRYVAMKKVDYLYTLGPYARCISRAATRSGFPQKRARHFTSRIKLHRALKKRLLPGTTILVIGSNKAKISKTCAYLRRLAKSKANVSVEVRPKKRKIAMRSDNDLLKEKDRVREDSLLEEDSEQETAGSEVESEFEMDSQVEEGDDHSQFEPDEEQDTEPEKTDEVEDDAGDGDHVEDDDNNHSITYDRRKRAVHKKNQPVATNDLSTDGLLVTNDLTASTESYFGSLPEGFDARSEDFASIPEGIDARSEDFASIPEGIDAQSEDSLAEGVDAQSEDSLAEDIDSVPDDFPLTAQSVDPDDAL
ncbi:hypothetical protein I532_20306 [Brevibacillus borstelensis AK1]|uniref:Mur ligase C-terminal domain-containing protein n=1 Tax=Brevibacillus borstelensis AK1 TaxID=1300222 RepID=M8E6A7_9BACL|nr:hypothetical protein [Brevibacillus borstelensis]EMT50985.1 hypothetical protein I532_20306 [Brevibacillus borstelensis AK1]